MYHNEDKKYIDKSLQSVFFCQSSNVVADGMVINGPFYAYKKHGNCVCMVCQCFVLNI